MNDINLQIAQNRPANYHGFTYGELPRSRMQTRVRLGYGIASDHPSSSEFLDVHARLGCSQLVRAGAGAAVMGRICEAMSRVLVTPGHHRGRSR